MKRKKILGVSIAIFIGLLASIPTNAGNNVPNAKSAAQKAENKLLLLEGITGISYTDDPPRVIVMIESEEYRSLVPSQILGVKTEIRITGEIRALGFSELETIQLPQLLITSRHAQWDPLVGGISVGTRFLRGSYGTLSVCTGSYLLSCTHVIALTDNAFRLFRGFAVVQPGLYDGGGPVVGRLYKYIRIKFGGFFSNYADAAIAKLKTDVKSYELLGADNVSTYNVTMEAVVPAVGQTVRKSGATSGVTQNIVSDIHATILVKYGFRIARFRDIIVVNEPFIEPGDSGSFVDLNGKFVGLAFAGGTNSGYVCKASYIKTALGI